MTTKLIRPNHLVENRTLNTMVEGVIDRIEQLKGCNHQKSSETPYLVDLYDNFMNANYIIRVTYGNSTKPATIQKAISEFITAVFKVDGSGEVFCRRLEADAVYDNTIKGLKAAIAMN